MALPKQINWSSLVDIAEQPWFQRRNHVYPPGCRPYGAEYHSVHAWWVDIAISIDRVAFYTRVSRCFLTAGNHSVLLFRITAITISLEFQSLSESLNTDREILIPYIFYFENPCSIWLYLRYLFLLVIITNETISDGFTVRCS